MSNTSPRLMIVATLLWAGLGPALATPPAHPPLPPARPAFPDDDLTLRNSAEAGQEAPVSQEPQAQAPQAQAPEPPPAVARPDDDREVAERPVPPAASAQETPEEEQVPGFVLAQEAGLAELTRKYARRHGVPLSLLHRVIMRESRYHPHLVNRRYYGLMQITHATARSMGYHGTAKGLLDPETNLAFAAPYLANAWALAEGDQDRAVQLYASGYYYTAKNKGMLGLMRNADSPPAKPEPTVAAAAPPPPRPKNILESLFGGSAQ